MRAAGFHDKIIPLLTFNNRKEITKLCGKIQMICVVCLCDEHFVCVCVCVCVGSPLPRQVFLEEDVPAGLTPAHRRPRLAGLQHAHGAGRVGQGAQVLADGARVG